MKKKDVIESPTPEVIGGIEVGNPQLLRPVELPLVVKPEDGGEWKNEAQAEYAKIVNAYAYKNKRKWSENQRDSKGKEIPNSSKKVTLVARLIEIGENPAAIAKYRGHLGNLSFKNKLIEQ